MSGGIPWAPQGRPDNTIAQMILQAGRDRAEGLRRGSAITANALGSLGDIAQGYYQQKREEPFRQAQLQRTNLANQRDQQEIARYQEQKDREGKFLDYIGKLGQDENPDPKIVFGILGADKGSQAIEAVNAFRSIRAGDQQSAMNALPYLAEGFSGMTPETKASMWAPIKNKLEQSRVVAPGQLPNEYSPQVDSLVESFRPKRQTASVGRGAKLIDTVTKEVIAQGDPVEKAPPSIEEQIIVADRSGDKAEVARLLGVKAKIAAAGRQPDSVSYEPKLVMVDGREVQANYNSKTGKYHDPETAAVLKGVSPPPTADMRNKGEGRKLVTKSINAIQSKSEKIITKIGPAQRAEALKRGAEAVFGNDPDFRTYQDARYALAGNLAVAQQGSRPSDADIKLIWLPLVPNAYSDTSESAKQKWELIKEMSNSGEPAPAAAPTSQGGSLADKLRAKHGIPKR